MGYKYEEVKPKILTDEGQRGFLKIRDNVQRLLKQSGAVRIEETWNCDGCPSSSWDKLACYDRMVELGELRELTPVDVPGQHRVFVSAKW